MLQSMGLKESDPIELLNNNKVALAVKEFSLVFQLVRNLPAVQETWV